MGLRMMVHRQGVHGSVHFHTCRAGGSSGACGSGEPCRIPKTYQLGCTGKYVYIRMRNANVRLLHAMQW